MARTDTSLTAQYGDEMSPALIPAFILLTMLYRIVSSRHRPNRHRGASPQQMSDPGAVRPLDVFGERRQASTINAPRRRSRLNDQVARLLAMLAATSFAIAIASRYISSW
jgi:hypothetical protein